MSRMRLYIDEDAMRHATVSALRTRTVNVVTAAEAGMLNRSDEEQLTAATLAGRVLYTFNARDFFRLHQAWLSRGLTHAGIIVGEQKRFSPGAELRCLMRLFSAITAVEMQDRIEFLSSWI